MFNFNLTPVRHEKIEQGALYIELPVYEDLLGSEYDVIEQMEVEEMEWNTKILDLTKKLAASRNMLLVDVYPLLNAAENAGMEERIEFLGEFFPEFVTLINSKPSSKKNVLKLVTEICRRVKPDITEADIEKLPRQFVEKIHGFAIREQIGGQSTPYKELLTLKQNFEFEYTKARAVIDDLYKLYKDHSKSKSKELIEGYYASFDSLGKQI